jgi:periplasmic divalent cation tolerance protein
MTAGSVGKSWYLVAKRSIIMTDKIVVLVTGGTVTECKRIAKQLLDKKLIACANVLPTMYSLYHWQGKIADERECLMILKSSRELFPALQTEVEKLHSYSVPEVVALPIVDGAQNYLNWLAESVAVSQDTA